MKKHMFISFTALLFLSATVCFSQRSTDLGFKAGLSIPNLTAGNSNNPINSGYRSRLGPDAAIHIEFHLSKHFSVQPQLEYSSQGGKKNSQQAFTVPDYLKPMFPPGLLPSYLYADYKSTAKINYLMLPVLAKYRYELNDQWGFYAAAGPFVSMVLSAKNVTSGNSKIYLDQQQNQPLSETLQSFDHTEKIKKDLHPANTGINGHIGISYKQKNGSFFVEGGGNYGLVNIQNSEVNGKNKTGAGSVTFGYQFRMKGN